MADKQESSNVTERASSADNKHGTNIATDIEQAEALKTMDPIAESRLVWKFDLRILPVLAVMYLFNSLDKSNLGNAKTAGLEKDLKLGDHGYNIILSVFFVPYVLTAPFLGILGKKYGPNKVLPCMMFAFGSFTLLVAAVKNFGGLLTLRWFLGMSESAFFPLVIYYQVCPLARMMLWVLMSMIDNILSARRVGKETGHLLCGAVDRQCLRRLARIRRLPHPFRVAS